MSKRDSGRNQEKILQIVPANRWEAAFADAKNTRVLLVGWALVQTDDGRSRIKGVIPAAWHQMQFCEDIDEFLCYVPEGMPIPGHSNR